MIPGPGPGNRQCLLCRYITPVTSYDRLCAGENRVWEISRKKTYYTIHHNIYSLVDIIAPGLTSVMALKMELAPQLTPQRTTGNVSSFHGILGLVSVYKKEGKLTISSSSNCEYKLLKFPWVDDFLLHSWVDGCWCRLCYSWTWSHARIGISISPTFWFITITSTIQYRIIVGE